MAANASSSSNHDAPQGLPPVKPPSGRFIIQLFLIPGVIVFGLVLVFVFGGLSWVGTSTPEGFLERLDNPNPDVRWRAAHELAQVLKRPESLELASDPDFALEIAVRLEKAFKELEDAEKETKRELGVENARIKAMALKTEDTIRRENEAALAAWRKLRPQRDLVLFLANCLGDFTIPVGVNILGDIAQKEGVEIKGTSLRRRRAVWALANLGNNMQVRYFGKNVPPETKVLSEEQKKGILVKLAKAAGGTGYRARIADYARNVLMKKIPSNADGAGVVAMTGVATGAAYWSTAPKNADVALANCAKSDDVFLRAEVAFALNFWDGDLVEPTLLLLSKDDGHGTRIEITDVD